MTYNVVTKKCTDCDIGSDWFEDNGEVETVVTPITGSGRDHPTVRNVLFVVGTMWKSSGTAVQLALGCSCYSWE